MWRSFLYCSQTEETEEEKKKGTDVDEADKMEVDEEKAAAVAATTPVPTDQDSSNSQTQKSESASKGPEDVAPVTENAENAEVSNNGHFISFTCGLGDFSYDQQKQPKFEVWHSWKLDLCLDAWTWNSLIEVWGAVCTWSATRKVVFVL